MSLTLETLEAEALQLPQHDRAVLIERLLASLGPDPANIAAWDDEVARREAAMEADPSIMLPGFETLDELEKEFQ